MNNMTITNKLLKKYKNNNSSIIRQLETNEYFHKKNLQK